MAEIVPVRGGERPGNHVVSGLVRISVGLENVDDLIADIEQALEKSQA